MELLFDRILERFVHLKTMRNLTIFFYLFLCMHTTVILSKDNPYGLKTIDYPEYLQSVKANPDKELVDLEVFIPELVLDIKYASYHNFTKQKIYTLAKAYARRQVTYSLKKAQKEFLTLGYRIKIFDAYRPYKATVLFYELIKDTRYVASPKSGSRHNKGCAIDLTLVDSNTQKEVTMPTEYDSFQREAWPSTPVKDLKIQYNRDLLISTLAKYGFQVNRSEWWHYDYRDCKNFEVMDISFEELANTGG